jgi:hypothetical protein
MTTLTDTQVVTASGGLVELGYAEVTSGVAVTSTNPASPTTVVSPVTVVCDGGPVSINFDACQAITASSPGAYISLWRDGAELSRYWGVLSSAANTVPVSLAYRDTPSAGSHTYSVRAHVSSWTLSFAAGGGTTTQSPILLRVSKIVQATQWPAVTTGTIICTSTTRPASPFAGQRIYETDTLRSWTYSGAQWVPDDMVFTNEAARDAAITSPTEGMRAYLTAPTVPAATGATSTSIPTGITTIYNGSVWVCTTEVGAAATAASQTLTTSYADLLVSSTATSVTLVTGTTALVMMTARLGGTSNFGTLNVKTGTVGAAATGATTPQVSGYSIASRTFVMTGLTAGTNTFTLIGTVNIAGGTFDQHTLVVRGIA